MEEEESRQHLNPYIGDELMSWTFDEYERHERGPVWYALAALIGVALLLYAIISQNFLFAVILIMFAVIIGLSTLRDPQQLPFAVTTRGVVVGDDFYSFKELRSFWVAYEPPSVKHVYFEFRSPVAPHLVVPLHDQNPVELRGLLLEFLDEDLSQEDEPLSRMIGRMLKL